MACHGCFHGCAHEQWCDRNTPVLFQQNGGETVDHIYQPEEMEDVTWAIVHGALFIVWAIFVGWFGWLVVSHWHLVAQALKDALL